MMEAPASASGHPSTPFPFAMVVGHLSLEDIAGADVDRDPDFETPIPRLLSDSKTKGYDTVFIPLTNERWRESWRMCLPPEDEAEKDESAEQISEAWRMRHIVHPEQVHVVQEIYNWKTRHQGEERRNQKEGAERKMYKTTFGGVGGMSKLGDPQK